MVQHAGRLLGHGDVGIGAGGGRRRRHRVARGLAGFQHFGHVQGGQLVRFGVLVDLAFQLEVRHVADDGRSNRLDGRQVARRYLVWLGGRHLRGLGSFGRDDHLAGDAADRLRHVHRWDVEHLFRGRQLGGGRRLRRDRKRGLGGRAADRLHHDRRFITQHGQDVGRRLARLIRRRLLVGDAAYRLRKVDHGFGSCPRHGRRQNAGERLNGVGCRQLRAGDAAHRLRHEQRVVVEDRLARRGRCRHGGGGGFFLRNDLDHILGRGNHRHGRHFRGGGVFGDHLHEVLDHGVDVHRLRLLPGGGYCISGRTLEHLVGGICQEGVQGPGPTRPARRSSQAAPCAHLDARVAGKRRNGRPYPPAPGPRRMRGWLPCSGDRPAGSRGRACCRRRNAWPLEWHSRVRGPARRGVVSSSVYGESRWGRGAGVRCRARPQIGKGFSAAGIWKRQSIFSQQRKSGNAILRFPGIVPRTGSHRPFFLCNWQRRYNRAGRGRFVVSRSAAGRRRRYRA